MQVPKFAALFLSSAKGNLQASISFILSLESHHRLFRRRPRTEVSLSLCLSLLSLGVTQFSTYKYLSLTFAKQKVLAYLCHSSRHNLSTVNVSEDLVFSFQSTKGINLYTIYIARLFLFWGKIFFYFFKHFFSLISKLFPINSQLLTDPPFTLILFHSSFYNIKYKFLLIVQVLNRIL